MGSRANRLAASLMLATSLAGFSLARAAREARAAGARASSVPFHVGLRVSANAESGAVNLLTVTASAPSTAVCTLQMSAGRFEKTLPGRRPGGVAWRWRAPNPAPKGVWTFTATCREGASWSASWYKAEMGFPERSGALAGAPAHTLAARESCDGQRVCFADDPFPVGECTWYALGRRPDLAGTVRGAAREWLRAAEGRVAEGSRPAVGALAVYVPAAGGAPGHVGYVAAISGSRILLDDSNWWPTPWSPRREVHEHWESASAASGYIYGGPAGAGPDRRAPRSGPGAHA
jgi:surface antigen